MFIDNINNMEMYQLKKRQKFYLAIKRLFDILFALLVILLLSWFILILLLINLISSKGHPVFAQERVGKKGKTFRILKFRTMKYGINEHMTSADPNNTKENCTRFGRFLRMTSLDEILQIFNIFVGQMSFIGPRPLIDEGVDHLTIEYRKQNGAINIRPGITGLAQINGRVNASPEKKSEYDAKYYQKLSMWLDIKIFFITIFKTLTRKDIFDEGTENEK